MPSVHVVKQGECLATIAKRYGFADYRTIYNHGDNAELRKQRPNPHVLYPGDRIAIPERTTKAVKVPTTRQHTFRLKRPKVFLRLAVLGHVAGHGIQARYELRIDGAGEPIKGTIGADGKLDVAVSPLASMGELTLRDPETEEILDVIDIRIGALDPVTTTTGVRSRLRRLGFDCGREQGPEMGPLTREALALFQRVHAIEEDGEAGPRTQTKLLKLAGA